MSDTWKLLAFLMLAFLAQVAQAFFTQRKADFDEQRIKAQEFIQRADSALRANDKYALTIDDVQIKPRLRGCRVKAHWTGRDGITASVDTTL